MVTVEQDPKAYFANPSITPEEEQAFWDQATYGIEVACAEYPDNQVSPLEMNYRLIGDGSWSGFVSLNRLDLIIDGISSETFMGTYGRNDNTITFESHNNTKGTIKKVLCTNATGKQYEYQVSLHLDSNMTYEDCATLVDNFFIDGQTELLADLITKTGYHYQGSLDPKTTQYSLSSRGDLMELYLPPQDRRHFLSR